MKRSKRWHQALKRRRVQTLAETIWRVALAEVRADEGYDDGKNDYSTVSARTQSAMRGIAKWLLKHKKTPTPLEKR